MTQWMVTIVGAGSLALASLAQADEPGLYFKFDAGAALPQDVAITKVGQIELPAVSYDGLETYNQPKAKLRTGFRGDLAAGYAFNKMFSVELDAGVVYNPLDKLQYSGTYLGVPYSYDESPSVNLWQVPLLANVIFTIPLDSKFKRFIGAGAGGIWTVLDGEDTSNNDFTFAFQGLAGINYAISDNVDIGVVYKFLGTLEHNLGDLRTDPVYTHSIMAVLTCRF
jgi:opacity protein-like surface antigen